jgi:hypothetical protein
MFSSFSSSLLLTTMNHDYSYPLPADLNRYLIIAMAAFTFYWVDKYLFTRWYRTPPQYDAQISIQFTSYLPYAAILHLLFGTWMIANRRMFSSDDGYQLSGVATNSSSAGGGAGSTFHQSLLAYVGDGNGKKNDILSALNQQQ